MAVQARVCLADTAATAWLGEALGPAVILVASDETRQSALVAEISADTESQLLFVRARKDTLDAATGLIEEVAEARPGLPIIAIGDDDDSTRVLACIRAGADDFVVRGRDEARLPGIVSRRVAPRERAVPSAGSMALVVASLPSADVVFFAAHLAMGLSGTLERGESPGRRVLLIDASLPGGTLPILFGQTPDFYLKEALSDVARCDATLVDSAFPALNSGVSYLCHPEGHPASDVIELLSRLPALIDQLAPLFDDLVVVAEPGIADRALQDLRARAQRAYLCLDTSVAQVRQTAALLARMNLRGDGKDVSGLVVTRQVDPSGLSAQRLSELLGVPVAAHLTDRVVERHRAMDEGRVLRANTASAAFVDAAKALAADVSGQVAATDGGTGESGRLRRAWQALRGAS